MRPDTLVEIEAVAHFENPKAPDQDAFLLTDSRPGHERTPLRRVG